MIIQKKTKIVCTVGPSTDKSGVLENMINAGMNVARFNFSHGTHVDHAKRIMLVRNAATITEKCVALMLDTKGPEMRIGKFTEKKVHLIIGQTFILTGREVAGTTEIVSINYKNLVHEVTPGTKILLSDGLIELMVEKSDGDKIITRVLNSGEISDNKRVAVPGVCIKLPPVSEQDAADIRFGIEQNMDFIAASFVQQASDILAIRKLLEDANAQMGIIAKIENSAGVDNIDAILKVADGVMVARGDLGVEIPLEDVPMIQKMLIQKCKRVGKPVITATQMLESMVINPRPTRAESSDIANAILDGTDAIMLSGETASGQYPIESVITMAKIAVRTERELNYDSNLPQKELHTTTDAVSHASVQMAHDLGASAIITATESGYTARMISKYRPKAMIVAVTPYERNIRQLQLLWGVYPLIADRHYNSDELVENSIEVAKATGLIADRDLVVITAGLPVGLPGTTNMIRVHVVANILLKGQGIGQKVITGKVYVVKNDADIHQYPPGDILVVSSINDTNAAVASQATAIIAEEGGLSSNAAVIGVNYNLPVIVNVVGATECLQTGMQITVDADRGLIYQGDVDVK